MQQHKTIESPLPMIPLNKLVFFPGQNDASFEEDTDLIHNKLLLNN